MLKNLLCQRIDGCITRNNERVQAEYRLGGGSNEYLTVDGVEYLVLRKKYLLKGIGLELLIYIPETDTKEWIKFDCK